MNIFLNWWFHNFCQWLSESNTLRADVDAPALVCFGPCAVHNCSEL